MRIWVKGSVDEMDAVQFSGIRELQVIDKMIFDIVTSKSNQSKKRLVQYTLTSASFGEVKLLEMFSAFMRLAQYEHGMDMVFSRPNARSLQGSLGMAILPLAVMGDKRFRYQQAIVNRVVKACAVRLGLDPVYFTTKSFKNCGISTMQSHRDEVGMNEMEVAKFFDHQTVSANRHYQRPDLGSSGPLGFMTENGGRLYDHGNLVLLAESRVTR